MKIKNDQSGVAHLAAVLAVVVVVAIGAVGWKVWDNKDKKQNSAPNPVKVSDASPTETTETKAVQESKYLEIKEYGIKIELSEALEDAYYVMENGYPYLSTHSLDKFEGCSQVAAVNKAQVGDDHFGSPYTKDELEKISKLEIDATYFWVEPSNGGSCSNPGGQTSDPLEQIARSEFTSAKLLKL